MSQTIKLHLSREERGAVATTSSASTETILSQNGDYECVSKDGLVMFGATPPGSAKRPRDVTGDGDHPEESPLKYPRTEEGSSTPSTINVATMCLKKGKERRVSDEMVLSH